MRRKTVVLSVVAVMTLIGLAWARGDWNSAQSKVEDMKRRQMELRRMTPDEIRRIVSAVCEAEEDDRKQVGRDAAERVASLVKSELDNLERMRDSAYLAIDDVLADQDLKDRHDDAKRLREDVSSRWNSIERMAKNAMRGGNHPLVSYLVLKGIEEHQRYQQNSSNCDAYEFNTGSRRADCLKAESNGTCYVIELKPNNQRARDKGRSQARDSADDLERETAKGESSDVIKKLIDKDSDFKACKRWEAKLRCYSLCPTVDDEGEFREGSVSWSDC